MREAARAHRQNACDERADSEAGDRARRLAQCRERDDGCDQGRKPAHHRISDGEVGAVIKPSDQQKIDDMDSRRGDDERERRVRRPRQDERGRERGHAAPDCDDCGSEELVARALDERVPQGMKGRRAEDGGQNAGTEVVRIGHERVTVMDSPLAVEARGEPALRQRARAEARGSFVRVGARTEPARLFETGGLRWRFPRSSSPCEAAIVNTGGGVAGGDSYVREPDLRRRRRGRGDDAFGGADLPQPRARVRHRDPACASAARAALLAASGNAGLRRRAARAAPRGRGVRRG